jgi:hypothetical protein
MPQPSVRVIEGISPATETVEFSFEGHLFKAWPGEAIASALMRAGIRTLRLTRTRGEDRGYFCGMGLCWECAVYVEGNGVVRGCSHPVSGGQVVKFADGSPNK